jgi:hypothetical protein
MEPRHERIARVALAAGARYGLALAGGYAVSAHGMGARPSGDVDLFTSWQHGHEFPELATAVIAALESAGYAVAVVQRAETFLRLTVTDPTDGMAEEVELSADWRAHDPVILDVGPVLHADDAVANKVCALFGAPCLETSWTLMSPSRAAATPASSCLTWLPTPTAALTTCCLPTPWALSLRSRTPHSPSTAFRRT